MPVRGLNLIASNTLRATFFSAEGSGGRIPLSAIGIHETDRVG
jgi:hypothetical protein